MDPLLVRSHMSRALVICELREGGIADGTSLEDNHLYPDSSSRSLAILSNSARWLELIECVLNFMFYA
jgi:hypothetical protein